MANVDVPFTVGDPNRRPEGRNVSPAGGCPENVYGGAPPLARKPVEKKLFTNTLLPAPTSQTPFAQVKNRLSSASGGFVPVPVPVIGTFCGLFGALSVRMNVAERAPVAVSLNVIDTLQLPPAGSVRPEQPSSTCVKSSASAPRVCALLMNSEPVPVFLIVSDVGVNVTAGAAVVPPPPPPPPPPP